MSYDIYIGEAEIDVPDEDDGNELTVRVRGIAHDDAPSFPGDEMTGNGNSRHPGYSQWADFCRAVGLHDLFFDKTGDVPGLMVEHPGCVVLRRSHGDAIHKSLAAWRTQCAGKVAGWDPNADFMGKAKPGTTLAPEGHYDGNLARLVWLDWWVRWALAECKTPALYNR